MKTQNPFTGRSSGSLANVVASTYLGQNILKSKPLEVRNPQSPKQINVRAILAQAGTLGRSLSSIQGIAKRAARTGRNTNKTARTALVAAILATKSGVAPSITLSSIDVKLSGNGIAETSGITASMDISSGQVMVNWSTSIPSGGLPTDLASLVLFNLTKKTVWVADETRFRSVWGFEANAPSGFADISDIVGGFICFDSQDLVLYDSISSFAVSLLA